MRPRTVFAAALLALLFGLDAAGAERGKPTYRVGYLQTASRAQTAHLQGALEAGFRELGYVQGRNLVLDYRFADGKPDRLPGLAEALVRLKPDAIITGLNPVTLVVKQATTSIPIVTALGADMVEAGLVQSLARPGGNVTGLTVDVGGEIFGKRLQLLREIDANVSRIAVLYNPRFRTRGRDMVSEVEDAARTLHLTVQRVEVPQQPDGFAATFASMSRAGIRALYVMSDPLAFAHRTRLTELAAAHKMVAVYGTREYVEAGGLIAYATDLRDLYRRAAGYVDRILKGATPRDLPVEQPTKFELLINLNTARALDIAIPSSLLLQADQVLQ